MNEWLAGVLLFEALNLDAREDAATLALDQPLRVGHQAPVQVLEEVEQVAGQDEHVRLHWHLKRKKFNKKGDLEKSLKSYFYPTNIFQ